ncbi:hypothetical protein MKX01_003344, partial [Papaver californicum]
MLIFEFQFNIFGLVFSGSQEPPPSPRVQGGPGQTSWYPPPVVGSSNSSLPSTPCGGSSSSSFNMQQSIDESRRLLTDREAYNQFLFSLDQVKIQNNVRNSRFFGRWFLEGD